MIPLTLQIAAEADKAFVTRLRTDSGQLQDEMDSLLLADDEGGTVFAGHRGLISIDGFNGEELAGDVLLVEPEMGRAERLLRSQSAHNTLLVTERCDQLCVMCSQPPKKTHVDRFDHFKDACLLAEADSVIGISGGEPTLYKAELLDLVETVLTRRPDLTFHILTNAQHFGHEDIAKLRAPLYDRVAWGIPLYSSVPAVHDFIVGKQGAFQRLHASLGALLQAGARIELRTVLMSSNLADLPALSQYVAARLRFIETWSVMQLENIGFAKNRWSELFVDHSRQFDPIGKAVDHALLHGIDIRLFNFPRCSVPASYRALAPASISDWKRKYQPACAPCSERDLCSGFFEWHPDDEAGTKVTPL
ncbi:His-Xaa-Ser system radical SAM maturase HxsC [Novosphingobium sp. P6W]|uniref:His-Xaa-Ser system radical SAM maturase HxsC n=1 Tax=Novosphingobium sp. P6W TaxID=1609758 RepID=UPI0005C2BA01|nr:His-Xaa-Ser system radical SAM maturase HxsC [Novosphingobium sp. P6W]AXB78930.1 His-Xaa-Ser system radical SAM maturase HxsC [Novosphingobium sp. P6W]KIS29625.1 radical SAM superfamily protein [Novosphingobium sp. P6W]